MKNMLSLILAEDAGLKALSCSDPNVMKVMKIISIIFIILKILVPLILIVTGIIELSKSVISEDDKELSKSLTTFVTKLLVGICIFFLPSVMSSFVDLIDGSQEVKSDFAVCTKCILNIKECENTTNNGNNSSNKTNTVNKKDKNNSGSQVIK